MTLPIHPELGSDFTYNEALNNLAEALNGTSTAPAAQQIAQQVLQICALLLKKNKAYGNSALDPLSVFTSGLTPTQRMGVRMDDKLSRLARGTTDGEDPEIDLAGYIVLRRIAAAKEASGA